MIAPERPLPRSWLYVPGHRADVVAKALGAGADAVVLDLEDAVPAEAKDQARRIATRFAADRPVGPQLWVRVNALDTPWAEDDLDAATGWEVDGLRLPRAENPAAVRQVAERTRLPLQLLLETAAGLAEAAELAATHPLVAGIGLGETDLSADLRVLADAGLDWARGWVVVAARAAGLPSPVQSVWTDLDDLDGLRRSTERAHDTGFVGRSVLHPRHLPVVHDVFTPSPEKVRAAEAVVRTADEAAVRGEVVAVTPEGRFVDPAVVKHARFVLALAAHRHNQEPPDEH